MERDRDNKCLACIKNCCRDFMVALQKTDPQAYQELLRKFSFIKITDQELTFFNGREAVMNVHECERLREDGSCGNYYTVERPQFCIDAGVKGAPHKECLIFNHKKS